jgi:hypothetical protein
MLRSAKQFCKAGLATDPACPFCGQCEEDVSHIFLACVAWDHIRLKFPEVSLQWLHDAAACSRSCAVPLLPDGVVQSNEKLWTEDQLETSKPLSSWDLDMETVENGHVVVWTDGACSAHTIPYLRRAGYGVAYDKDLSHSRSISLPLAGPEQSAQRAEVRALLAIMAIESRPLWVRSDSKYTVDVFNQIVSGYSLPSDRAPRSLATNRDPVLSSI